MSTFGGPVTRRAVLGDISNRTAAHDAKSGKNATVRRSARPRAPRPTPAAQPRRARVPHAPRRAPTDVARPLARQLGGFLGAQKGMGLGAEGMKTLGGLNPKQSLAHMDASMRSAKIGADSFSSDIPDPVDAGDTNDAQCVVPYIKDIMRCMRETEVRAGRPATAPLARAASRPLRRRARALPLTLCPPAPDPSLRRASIWRRRPT